MKRQWMIMMVAMVAMVAMAQEKPDGDGTARKIDRSRGGWRGMDFEAPMMKIDKDLGLSKEQEAQMRTIFAGSTNEMKRLHAKMLAAAKMQAELMSQDSPNEEAVMKGADEIAAVRAEIGKISIRQMLAAQKILTPEQRAKMREKMKSHMDERGVKGEGFKHRGEGVKKVRKPVETEKTVTPEKAQ